MKHVDVPAPADAKSAIAAPAESSIPATPNAENAILTRLNQACQGYSIIRVARLTGHNPETTRRYLRGMARPTCEFVSLVGQSTGCRAEWLFYGTGEMYPTENEESEHRRHLAEATTAELFEAIENRLHEFANRVQEYRAAFEAARNGHQVEPKSPKIRDRARRIKP